jgi:hypothetical protein
MFDALIILVSYYEASVYVHTVQYTYHKWRPVGARSCFWLQNDPHQQPLLPSPPLLTTTTNCCPPLSPGLDIMNVMFSVAPSLQKLGFRIGVHVEIMVYEGGYKK